MVYFTPVLTCCTPASEFTTAGRFQNSTIIKPKQVVASLIIFVDVFSANTYRITPMQADIVLEGGPFWSEKHDFKRVIFWTMWTRQWILE